jgi:hypothetical protein
LERPIKALNIGRDVYPYFDNGAKVRASADAKASAEHLDVQTPGRTGPITPRQQKAHKTGV